ncbi:MAG: dihydroorotate dehydrogenase-like protein [Balneolaceae bacterium]|nr:dihydroorotate dehydrogenase-like protein [Balneolaceae bacterium]MBO6546785.1 dihydroorotate dehydrogenase-like protein [Balneolaceae bacterium]MBO6649145.1 dihydroorotate dehydrogenase-like protein [Balneolaceae bacterium]
MDLSTRYLGLELKNPLVPSASPLSKNMDSLKRLAEAGAGAIVMHSLFEEQINATSMELDHFLSHGTESFGEALSYFPDMDEFEVGPDSYLEHIAEAKNSISIPVIGSLNGISNGGWINYAKLIEEAGADALELNIYYIPTDPDQTSAEVEANYLEVIKSVCETVNIPVAVKFGASFSSIPNMAKRMTQQGAKGLVMFNRFYQPDFDIRAMEVVPHLILSNSSELRLPLRWTAILYKKIAADIAITTGIHNGTDVVKGILAGANITMVASELLLNGIDRIPEILSELQRWMEDYEYVSVNQMRGSMSHIHTAEPAAFERANYMKVLQSLKQDPTGKLWW